jgi:hypothetical protein
LQEQFQLMSVQPFVALAAEVMTNILVEFLAQQPVLLVQGMLSASNAATRALNSSTFLSSTALVMLL